MERKEKPAEKGLLPTNEIEDHFNFFQVIESTIVGVIDFIIRFFWTLVHVPLAITIVTNTNYTNQYTSKAVRPFTFLVFCAFCTLPIFYNNYVEFFDFDNYVNLAIRFSLTNFMLFFVPFIFILTALSLFVSRVFFRHEYAKGRVYVYSTSYLVGFLMIAWSIIYGLVKEDIHIAVYLFLVLIVLVFISRYQITKSLYSNFSFKIIGCYAVLHVLLLLTSLNASYSFASKVLGGKAVFKKEDHEFVSCFFKELEGNKQKISKSFEVLLLNTQKDKLLITHTDLLKFETLFSPYEKILGLQSTISPYLRKENSSLLKLEARKELTYTLTVTNPYILEFHSAWVKENYKPHTGSYLTVSNSKIAEEALGLDLLNASSDVISAYYAFDSAIMYNENRADQSDTLFLFEPDYVQFIDVQTGHEYKTFCQPIKEVFKRRGPSMFSSVNIYSPAFSEEDDFWVLVYIEEILRDWSRREF